MPRRNTVSSANSHRSRYRLAVLLLSLALVLELAAITALVTLLLAISGGTALAQAILIASGAFATTTFLGLAVIRLLLPRP